MVTTFLIGWLLKERFVLCQGGLSNRQIRSEFTRTKILEITTSEFLLDANVRELRAKIVYRWIFYYDITGSYKKLLLIAVWKLAGLTLIVWSIYTHAIHETNFGKKVMQVTNKQPAKYAIGSCIALGKIIMVV